jgi:hypothetical protein
VDFILEQFKADVYDLILLVSSSSLITEIRIVLNVLLYASLFQLLRVFMESIGEWGGIN